VEEAPITILNMVMKKDLQLINVDPKQGGAQGANLFNPNGTLDEIQQPVTYTEMTKDRLI
jgi:hypothetical protein